MSDIHLGFEVGSGVPVSIPLKHTAVTGMTQESGKTTCLEALASRIKGSHFGVGTSLAFITKRGEGSFSEARGVQPYFRDRADWVFVDQILSAQLQEKNKWLRQFIIKICRTTSTLADVQREVRKALETAKGVNHGAYTQLDAYLDLIVPEISRWKDIRNHPSLDPGINVMDVSDASTPMQMLFVQSAIDWVNESEQSTVVIVPEAWEFIPEGKGSPVKASAVALARKGAAMGNYIWVDSQDMAGVDKTILRACTVWLIGVQREANEIKRNLSNIPHGMAKPSAKDVALLERGQFYACWGKHAIKTYVRPAWMPEEEAVGIARGTLSQRTVATKARGFHGKHMEIANEESFGGPLFQDDPPFPIMAKIGKGDSKPLVIDNPRNPLVEADVNVAEAEELRRENALLKEEIRGLRESLHRQGKSPSPRHKGSGSMEELARVVGDNLVQLEDVTRKSPTAALFGNGNTEALYAYVRDRLAKEAPKLLKVAMTKSEIEVEVTRETLTVDGKSLRGRIAQLLARGFFAEPKTQGAARTELKKTGSDPNSGQVSTIFADFVKDGFLRDESEGYVAVPGMKARIVESR